MTVTLSASDFKDFLGSKKTFKVDSLQNFAKILDLSTPKHNFQLANAQELANQFGIDIHISIRNKTLYNVKRRYAKCFWLKLRFNQDESRIFTNFEVHFEAPKENFVCQKTFGCTYATNRMSNIKRHEQICTSEQTIVDKQVAYGIDQTPIKRLIDLGYLPLEAENFRKTFFTTFDIECFEAKDQCELKNVVAIHKLVSVAVSTNKGHSKCFVRKDSSHDSLLKLTDQFLDFLEEIRHEYSRSIPNFFNTAIEKLDNVTSKDSPVKQREKMELSNLNNLLKKYLIHDIYGFNSGSKFILFPRNMNV